MKLNKSPAITLALIVLELVCLVYLSQASGYRPVIRTTPMPLSHRFATTPLGIIYNLVTDAQGPVVELNHRRIKRAGAFDSNTIAALVCLSTFVAGFGLMRLKKIKL